MEPGRIVLDENPIPDSWSKGTRICSIASFAAMLEATMTGMTLFKTLSFPRGWHSGGMIAKSHFRLGYELSRLTIDLIGDLGGILAFASEGQFRVEVALGDHHSEPLVAGLGFEPRTFRL